MIYTMYIVVNQSTLSQIGIGKQEKGWYEKMRLTSEERKEKGLTVEKVREMGLIYRLIDSQIRPTQVIGYASTREELDIYIMKEIAEKGENCDLITQKWIDKGFKVGWGYGRNFYVTKPREFIVNGILVKGVQKSY